MLAQKFRLPGARIPLVMTGREVFQEKNLTIKILPNGLVYSRLGVIISPRFAPGSVRRHRLKRQLLAVVKQTKVAPGFDVLIRIS